MKQSEVPTDRRKYPRFIPRSELFVLHSHFGKIENISMGGMLFSYLERDGNKNKSPYKVVLFAKQDDKLVELPYRTVSDTIYYRHHQGKNNLRERVVVFEDLNQSQFELLENFILENITISPWVEYLQASS